jgi:CHAT domain
VACHALTDIRGWLWDTAARPVLDELAARGLLGAAADGSAPRLWWCPTGLLTMFPWQAAGRIGPAGPDGVMDRVVSSFCFSVRSLAHTRRPPRGGGQRDHGPAAGAPLIVSVPFAPGARRLPAADDETRMLRERFPAALVLAGEQAGAGTVAAALPGHALVHFACHSLLDARSPTEGGLLLSDWQDRPFTVRDIAGLRLENAELAYLSACSTSETGIALLDEAVHVTSAFQLAGFRQVIGTLWPVRDQDAAEVARAFYTELGRGQGRSPDLGRAAAALHAAVRQMRSAFPDEPSRWGAHVHVGR